MNKVNPRSNLNTKNTNITTATVKIDDKIKTLQADEKSKSLLAVNKNTNPKRNTTTNLIYPSAENSLILLEKENEKFISTQNLIEIKRINLETVSEITENLNLKTVEFSKLEEIKKNITETIQENLLDNKTEQIIDNETERIKEKEKHCQEILREENEIPKKTFEEINFCISVDGSQHSEQAFEIVTEDLMKKHDKLIIIHIYNTQMDERYNYANKKETVIENYSSKLLRYEKSNVSFFHEDRVSKIHPLEQVNRICTNNKATYLICGYYGIKGPRGDNKELSKGLDYLLNYSTIPTIFIKEKTLRINKPDKQFKWLFVFDREYTYCYSILTKFLPLVDKEKDKVSGLTLIPSWVNNDTIKKDFMDDMEKYKIKNFEYDQKEYFKNPSNMVNTRVNFGNELYDFVVFYNCPEKHKDEGISIDVLNILTKCCSNICYVNGH